MLNRFAGAPLCGGMTASPAVMSRLVVCGPDRRIEVAVPAAVAVADLLPALLHHLGDHLADAGLAHGGWVLQRLGGPPLDEDGTVATLGLHDGEVVYLRPRADQIPPVHFDDLIDGVATGVADRTGRWRPAMVGWACAGSSTAVIALGLGVLALPGPPGARSFAAAVLAVLCLAGAFSLTRALAERALGMVCALGAVAAAGLAGSIAPDLTAGSGLVSSGGPQVLTGSAAALVAALLAAALVGRSGPVFAAVAAAAVFGVLGAGTATLFGCSGVQAAALTAVLATVGTVVVPMLAARLANVRMAPLPTRPEQLQDDIDPEPSGPLLARAAAADRFMTGLYAGTAVPVAVSMVLLAMQPGWSAPALATLVAVVRLLMLRPMTSAWHRLALALPAVLGLALVAGYVLSHATLLARLVTGLVFVPVAVAQLVMLARTMPGGRVSPYWGRAGDVTQLLATVALLPVLLAVLDVYAFARALGG
jgi:type VII secretion integral membrane protein EccD